MRACVRRSHVGSEFNVLHTFGYVYNTLVISGHFCGIPHGGEKCFLILMSLCLYCVVYKMCVATVTLGHVSNTK